MLTNIYTLDLSRTGKFGCMSKCINKKAHFECTFNYLLTSILLYNFFVLISHIFFFHHTLTQEGGVESGFRRPQSGSAPVHRLYQIKGKRNIRAKEVALSWESFNKGDCFILDLGEVSETGSSTADDRHKPQTTRNLC